MRRKKPLLFFSFILIFFASLSYIDSYFPIESQEKNPVELENILQKSSEYCEKLANSVLDIICKEKVTEIYSYKRASRSSRSTIFKEWDPDDAIRRAQTSKPKKISQNEYLKEWIYDYQLIRKNNKIKEQRILIYDNGIETKAKNAQLETSFRHEYMIHGPLSLLGKQWQHHHDYRIIDKEIVFGKEAIVIEAVPMPEFVLDHVWGRIWVSKDDYSILRIEWDQRSINKLEDVAKDAKVIAATEYNIEKNGIRFPSQYTLNATWTYSQSGNSGKTQIKVIYDDYKFFTVQTDVRLK